MVFKLYYTYEVCIVGKPQMIELREFPLITHGSTDREIFVLMNYSRVL